MDHYIYFPVDQIRNSLAVWDLDCDFHHPRIGKRDRVGGQDRILDHLRADLNYGSIEFAIDDVGRNRGVLAWMNPADICLVDLSHHNHSSCFAQLKDSL